MRKKVILTGEKTHMNLDVYAHCSIDSINAAGLTVTAPGGSACYCSIMAGRLGADVRLVGKYGPDFEEYAACLDSKKIAQKDCRSKEPTTRFRIDLDGTQRKLFLQNRCEKLRYAGDGADGVLASPIFGEIDTNLYDEIRHHSGFVFVDPQGFVRQTTDGGQVVTGRTDMDLAGVDAIKADADEMQSLTGTDGMESVKSVLKKGVSHILYTNAGEVTMYEKNRAYSLRIPAGSPKDTVGLGDIFSAAFCATMLKENDSLWAFCFAGGAVQAACESGLGGIEKIPARGATVTNASYFYNTVNFEQI